MEEILKYIGNIVRRQRLSKEMSTQELAEVLDVSPSLINNIENGRTDTFNLEFLYKLTRTLNIPILEIVFNNSINFIDEYQSPLQIDFEKELKNIDANNDAVKIKENVQKIVKGYLEAVAALEYNVNTIDNLTEKILYEFKYIEKIR